MSTTTKGPWEFACDSYGKVRHSKKACVYTNVRGPNGDRLVTIAARIPNWEDARLIAAAPLLLSALEAILHPDNERKVEFLSKLQYYRAYIEQGELERALAAIAAAKGGA